MTDPMVYDRRYIWTPLRTLGGIPWVSTRFSIRIENEEADTWRDGQTCLAKPNFQAWTGTRNFSPGQLIMWTGLATFRLICTLLYVMTRTITTTVVACTLNSRLLSGYLRVIAIGDFFSPSTMVRWVCNSRDSVGWTRVLLLRNVWGKSWTQLSSKLLVLASFFLLLYRHKTEGGNVSVQQ